MGINVKLDNIQNKKPDIQYPCIMISKLSRSIYLITNYSHGIILDCKEDKTIIGYHYNILNMDNLELFNGTITLSNNKE